MPKEQTAALAKGEAAKIAEAIGAEQGHDVEFLTSEDAAREIIARILEAEDFDAILSSGSTTPAEDVLDVPFVLRDVRFQKSGVEGEGPPVYALIEAVDPETGETLTITCGSRNVMAQALRLKQTGNLPTPKPVRIFRVDRPSASGFYPMWLGAASDEG
jgi:hypothetical protein